MTETFTGFEEEALRNPEVRAEYEALESKFRAEQEKIKRRIRKRIEKLGLPQEEKIEWMVKNVPDSEAREMIKDLLTASVSACITSNFNVLIEMIVDWEATIEVLNNPKLKKMVEGYRVMAEEHKKFAEESFPLAYETVQAQDG